MTPKRSVELPPVAGRLEITSLEDYVDQAMERIGAGTVDLSDEKVRAGIRTWLLGTMSGYLNALAWDLSKGADRGIRQVLQIARDPDYYQKASKRRKQRHERMMADIQPPVAITPPERFMDKGIELPQAEFGIYHVDTFEEPGFQTTLIGAANSQDEAEQWIARKFGPRSQDQRIRTDGADRVELVRISDRQIIKTWNVG
jgi:hypothetical protein